jgi:NADPH:quinone reductase-like Zn-dependent oxidoreductase
VPRRLATGNFKLCGVMLGYANAQLGAMLKQAMGWSLAPDSIGQKAMAEILALVRAGKLRPVIGEVVGFAGLPAAMTRMRDRRTTGRVIVTVD